MIRVVELFAGIGAQAQALENIGIPYEVVAISEIDRYAVMSYEAIHGSVNNLGDITKIDHLPECDLLTYSFPCQDLSKAGNKKGCAKGSGTRSGLLWEVERLLLDMREREALPMTLVMENVDALLYRTNIRDFDRWLEALSGMGYTSSYKVLDASDFGIPQRRRRVFCVSRLDGMKFTFPEPRPLTKCLADMLEDDVDESLYLKPEVVAKYEEHKKRQDDAGNGFGWHPFAPEEREGWNIDQQPLKTVRYLHSGADGMNRIIVCGIIRHNGWIESSRRVYDKNGVAPTLPSSTGGGHVPKIRTGSR